MHYWQYEPNELHVDSHDRAPLNYSEKSPGPFLGRDNQMPLTCDKTGFFLGGGGEAFSPHLPKKKGERTARSHGRLRCH